MATRTKQVIMLFLTTTLIAVSAASYGESLSDAWQLALKVDLRSKAMTNLSKAAAKNLSAARGYRLPAVTAEAAYTILDSTPSINLNVPLLGKMEMPVADDSFAFSRVTATIPLYTYGKISSGIDAATAMVGAAKYDQRRTMQEIKLEVAESYVAVLRAERGVTVADSSVTSLTGHVRDVENLFSQGLVAKNDLLASRVALSEAKQRLLQAQNQLDIARSAYNRLMGRTLTASVTLDEIIPAGTHESYESLVESALKSRPELAGLEQHEGAFRHQASGVRAATGPQIALSGGYTYLENQQLVRDQFWSVSLGLKWDLFDGGVLRNQAAALSYKADAVSNQISDLKSLVTLQIRQAWLEVEESRQRIIVAREAVGQAEENLAVANDRYR
ncbi:MAG: TolC family protein, partial [Desulfuromonadaceae bacterium]|nr:TolC family protein [Desulfuromonadaceae bacterium]